MRTSRRKFIKNSVIATIGAGLPLYTQAENITHAAIQLWTVRDFMDKDPKGTLQKIAQIGYQEIEAYGWDYFGMQPAPFKNYIDSLGLKMRSAHGALTKQKATDPDPEQMQESIDRASEAGLAYFVIPYLHPDCYNSEDNCKRTAEYFNRYGQMCKKSGIQLVYHNHDFEFQIYGGKTVYEHLLDHTDPKLVQFEMDLYWVHRGNKDPLFFFEKYKGRFPLWHLKDAHRSKDESTEIGNGKIDFIRILKMSKQAGLILAIVEQESYGNRTSLESAKICLQNLRKLKF